MRQRRFRMMARSGVPAALLFAVTAGCERDPLSVQPGSDERTFVTDSLLPRDAFAGAVRGAADPVDRNGLLYSAAAIPVDSALSAGPMSLRIVVTVANPAAEDVRLTVNGCTVWPEFRRAGETALAWVPQGQCAQAPYRVEIAAGGQRTFEFLAYEVMLAGALEDGRYDVTAQFRLPDETLRLEAGTADVRLIVPNLAFHVRLDETAGWPRARVRVENRNTVAVPLEWGHCSVGFELHRRADLSDAPQRLERERVCLLYLAGGAVPAGGILEAPEFTYTPAEHAGRNPDLARGTYHVVVTLRLNWRTYRLPMGTLELR